MSKLNIEKKEKFWAVNIVFKSWEGWGGQTHPKYREKAKKEKQNEYEKGGGVFSNHENPNSRGG